MTQPITPSEVEDFLAAQTKEYGTYVATQVIYIDGVRAFNPGDPVPVGHVTREVVPEESVKKVHTKPAGSQSAPKNPKG